VSHQLKNNLVHWRYAGIGLLLIFGGLVLSMFSTAESIVEVWSESRTYNHGFVILPITLWLIWQKRGELVKVVPEPVFLPLLVVAVLACFWLLSRLAGIQITEQFAFVCMLIAMSMSVLGWRLSMYLAFPLLFLVFAVPMGEELVPPMMDFTAFFTVEAIRLTGIPVYREGLWFVLPSGNWSVVEACSGIRYIIASITLGFLYAYISYHTLWKRLLFILLSALLPVVANGLRAYGIVMIGHLSGMELAVGVDHLVYGWVFFGIVMLLLFWIGGFWSEEHPPIKVQSYAKAHTARHPSYAIVVAAVGLLVAVGAQAAFLKLSATKPVAGERWQLPVTDNWKLTEPSGEQLAATYQPTDFVLHGDFLHEGENVTLFVAFYPNQRQGYEAVAKKNSLVRPDSSEMQLQDKRTLRTDFGTDVAEVNQQVLVRRSGGKYERLLVWQWFRIAGKELNGPYAAKLHEIRARITKGRSDGAWIAVGTPLEAEDYEVASVRLQSFVREVYPGVARAMDDALTLQR